MDIKDIGYLIKRFIYLPTIHTEEEEKARERKLVSLYGGNDGQISLYFGRYIITEDIEKRKEELRGYKF